MSYYDLNERAVLAMSNRLNTGLNANIDAVNATTAGDLLRNQTTIDYPAQVLDAPPVSGQLTNFPIVAIADGNMAFQDDVGWGATGIYEMVILVYVTDADPEKLAWKLRRYVQALLTTAILGRNVDSGAYLGAWGVILKKIVPGTRLTKRDQSTGGASFMQYAAIVLELKDEQNAP